MEYTVGSIADLISGKNTPNKPKVTKLTLAKPAIVPDKASKQKVDQGSKADKKKKKEKLSPSSGDSNMVVINHEMFSGPPQNQNTERPPKTKKSKKRKLDDAEEVVKTKKAKKKKEVSDAAEIVPPKIKKRKSAKAINTDDKEPQHDTKITKESRIERDGRTVFVGNVPVTIKKRQLLRLFGKYGHVESVRLRCIAPAEPGMPKRVAFIKKMLHPKRLTMHSYITFATREDALKALAANGLKYKDHHLRVQISNDTEKPDARKAIFVGNLPFDIEDDELWSTFESCGPIVSVRIVRDAATNMGIGIAYVNFESTDSVELALQMENVMIKKNVVRIHRHSQKKKHEQRQQNSDNGSRGPRKHYKRPKNYPGRKNPSDQNETGTRHSKNSSNEKSAGVTNITVKNSVFQGSKSNLKKKKPKLNKGVVNKIRLSKKIAPR